MGGGQGDSARRETFQFLAFKSMHGAICHEATLSLDGGAMANGSGGSVANTIPGSPIPGKRFLGKNRGRGS